MTETKYIKTRTTGGTEEWVNANIFAGTMVYPGAGIPLSSGSAWLSSISPSNGYLKYNSGTYSWAAGTTVYPASGIALSNGTGWDASIANNSANWNTAFGWGDHGAAGYVPLASPTFTGTVTLPSTILRGNADGSGTGLQWYASTTAIGLIASGYITAGGEGGVAADFGAYVYGNNKYFISTNGVVRQSVLGDGKIGLGLIAPIDRVHIGGLLGHDTGLRIGNNTYAPALSFMRNYDDSTLAGALGWSSILSYDNQGTILGGIRINRSGVIAGVKGSLYFQAGGDVTVMSVLHSGVVGINTITGLSALSINGGVHVGGDSDAGDNNILVDGYVKSDEINGITAFTSGFFGSGYKLDKTSTDYSLTIDNLTVRKLMRVYELEINKINSINGGIMVSVANGKAYSVSTLDIAEFTGWTNSSYETFISSGLNITSAINSSGVGTATLPNYTTRTDEVITILYDLTLNSGNAPRIVIGADVYILSAGANTITHTVVAEGLTSFSIQTGAAASDFELSSVSFKSNIQKIIFDEDESSGGTGNIIQFQENDYVRAQEWTGRGVDFFVGKVMTVVHSDILGSAYIRVMGNYECWAGADLVQVGNTTEVDRQNMIYITAADDNNPYIQMVAGVTDGDFAGHTKVMLGNLNSIASTGIVPASPGYGLFCDNVYLSGKIVATSGTIGGFTVNATDGLYSGSGATRVQMKAGAGFWAGATAIGDAPFSVTEAGVLKAIGNCTLGSATGQVDLGLTGSRGLVDVYSLMRFLGAKEHWSYSVQDNMTLTTIAYSCYRLDTADVAKTLTLPSDAQMNSYQDATIILVNSTKANFTIDSNSVPVYLKNASSVTSFVIAEGYAYTLIYIDHGTNPGWYQI